MASRLEVLRELPEDYLRHLGTLNGVGGLLGQLPLDELIGVLADSDSPTTEDVLNGRSLGELQALARKFGITELPRTKRDAVIAILAGPPAGDPGAGHLLNGDVRSVALAELRKGANPFSTAVAAVGTAAESLQTDVPSYTEAQLDDLLKIVAIYRAGSTATRVYPVVGDPGTGKTHLLYVLRTVLRQRALRNGEETLFVVVEHLASGTDPVDYLLWQITNHMLSNKGDGERMLRAVAGRRVGRLLAEALRRLSPPQQIELVPAAGFWQGVRMKFGSARLAQERVDAVTKLAEVADGEPEPAMLRKACEEAGVSAESALRVVTEHLDRTQSKNATDWFQKELLARLAHFALLGDRGPFDDFHNGETEPPAFVKDGGNPSRCLLDTWLGLLADLSIPVVVVYDQLEDYLRGLTPEQEVLNKKDFIRSVTSFIDKVPGVCVLAFAALGVWVDLVNSADNYAQQRLAQRFAIAGKPAQLRIEMPDTISPAVAREIVKTRIKWGFPKLDLTGLEATFPFADGEAERLTSGSNLRNSLMALSRRYDQIVYADPPDPKQLLDRLRARLLGMWNDQLAATKQQHGDEIPTTTPIIPQVQMALDGWLQQLHNAGLTGKGPWAKVEMVTAPGRLSYGYLTVVRLDENKPGIGIVAWIGQRRPKYNNLVKSVEYFGDNPCPVRTLVLLREDGEDALDGGCYEVFTKATKAKRDVRVAKWDAATFHAVMGFAGWYSAALSEVEALQRSGVDGGPVLRKLLERVSKPLLDWIDEWREPPAKGV